MHAHLAVIMEGTPSPVPSTYVQLVDALSPAGHWRFDEASGTAAADRVAANNGTYVGGPTQGIDPLVQNSDGGKSIGVKGSSYVTIPDLVTSASFTLDIAFQADGHKAKHILATTGGGSTNGQVSLEAVDDGAGGLRLRQWTVIGGAANVWLSSAGAVPLGEACKITYVQENGVGRRLYVDGVEVGARTVETAFAAPPTATWHIGVWPIGLADPAEGLLAELAVWASALTQPQIATLAQAQDAIWLSDWAKSVEELSSGIIDPAPHAHPNTGISAVVVSDGALVDLTANGAVFDWTSGDATTPPEADSATVRITKGALTSRTATISLTVTEQAAAALPAAPSTNAYWVDPINGSDGATAADARSATTSPSSNPWASLSKAIAEWNAGNLGASGSGHVEIILRGGLSYERGNNLTITRSGTAGSHLVVKGYRSDVSAGTRGGTGKFTGAKGWFVLRGNIESLETGGWEADPGAGAGRNIYRTTSTFSITGNARACWLGDTTHNLQLIPARDRDDLNTDNEIGVTSNPIYTAPGIVQHTDSQIYVRMDPTQWTDYFDDYFADSYYPGGVVPTWGTNPASEPLAVFDDTGGLTLNGAAFIDLEFFDARYWHRGLRLLGNTDNCTADYLRIMGSAYCVDANDAGTVHTCDFTHCDLIQNLAPWVGWTWVKENGLGIQAPLQGRTFNFTATYPHDINVQHCRFVRGFDGGGFDNGAAGELTPHDIVMDNNHFVWMRDDAIALHSNQYRTQFLNNYLELCWQGIGRVGRPASGDSANGDPGTVYIGFNVLDLRRSYMRGEPGPASGEYDPSGASGLAEDDGLQWGRVDPTHSIDNDEQSEFKYYHNLALCAKDESNVGVWSWKDGIKSAALQEERYNNVIINVQGAEYHGRGASEYIEQDYNMYYADPAGAFVEANLVFVNGGAAPDGGFSDWADFAATGGALYTETQHANGDGPGSPSGWEANGKEGLDPDFANGKWETIVAGDLSSYLPQTGGNMDGAVSLTATTWPGTGTAQSWMGPYAPGDAALKVGPEQGLWSD